MRRQLTRFFAKPATGPGLLVGIALALLVWAAPAGAVPNIAPTLTAIANLPGATEDTAFTIPYATLAAAADEADVNGDPLRFRVEAVTAGTLSKGGTPVVPGTTLLAAGEALVWTPAGNANGTIAAFTVKAYDGALLSSPEVPVNVIVTPVNDVPSFTKGANQRILEDFAQTVTGWATALSPGPADESGQTLNFIVTNDNNTLFAVQPAVSPDGTLTFVPGVDLLGESIVTVRIHDNGGTVGGGSDTSAAQTFTILIDGLNDAPSFTKGPDQTVLEDAGPQMVAYWATAISYGPPNEGQNVNFIVTNDNNSLFSAQPAVWNLGWLVFTPAANANGTATVTVKIHDNGGTYLGGVDTSPPQTFTITVTPVNDPPVNTVAPALSGTSVVGHLLTAGSGTWSDVDIGTTLTYSYQWYRADDNLGTNSAPIPGATGNTRTLTMADANKYLRVTVTADDGQGSSNQSANSAWTAIANGYPVTYDGNTNSSGSAPVDPGSPYALGSTVTLLGAGTLGKTGFTFSGWNTAANGSGTAYSAGNTFAMGAANLTLYAQWSGTVTYSGNGNSGGSAPTDPTAYLPGATVTAAANSGGLTRTGYTFAGWNTMADGSGTSYGAGSGTFSMAGDVTLYAQWTGSVTYSGNGNSGGSAPTDVAYLPGATVTAAANSGGLTRTGYTFAGWNTMADGSGTSYGAGTGTFTMAGDVTLYAQWSGSVTYSGNGNSGGSAPTDATAYLPGATVTAAANSGGLSRTGYTFAGWNTATDGSGTGYGAGSGTFTMTGDVTLYAQWTGSVTYSGNGNTGGIVPTDTTAYLQGATVTAAANSGGLIRTGYIFSGWNSATDGSGTGYGAGSGTFSMAGDVTLYAQWAGSVTYSGNGNTGGSVPTDTTAYLPGATVTAAANSGGLSRSKYAFAGWNTAADGTGTSYGAGTGTFTMAGDVTLYAQWTTLNNPPVFTGTPAISGTAMQGQTLGLTNTGTSDADGDNVVLSYQWRADGGTIGGATGSTYQLTGAEVGKSVTCVVTGDDGQGVGNSTVTATTAGVAVLADSDGDGVADGVDNCPTVANVGQANADGDGLGDACDSCPNDTLNDGDGDGICLGAGFAAPKSGGNDNCPTTANPTQADCDSDGSGDACDAVSPCSTDGDGDGVMDSVDNCPAVSNSSQSDANTNGIGDACDSAADTDRDGLSDADEIIAGTDPSNPDSDGDGFFDGQEVVSGSDPLDPNNEPLPTRIVRHDFNGDGRRDLLWHRDDNGANLVWLTGPDGAFVTTSSWMGTLATKWRILGVADFNGDGNADLLCRDDTTGQQLVTLTSPDGRRNERKEWFGHQMLASSGWSYAAAADFNGDGRADILWRHLDGRCLVWTTGATGLTVADAHRLGWLQPSWAILGSGDFNGDGKADLLCRDEDSGQLVVYLTGADGLTLAASRALGPIMPVANGWSVADIADFNGDGRDDILWHRKSDGDNQVWYLGGEGLALQDASEIGKLGPWWNLLGAGDVDGDGNADLLYRAEGTGQQLVYRTSADGFSMESKKMLGHLMDSASGWRYVGK